MKTLEGQAETAREKAAFSTRLVAELEAQGPEALHVRLRSCDPETAARLQPRDRPRRVDGAGGLGRVVFLEP